MRNRSRLGERGFIGRAWYAAVGDLRRMSTEAPRVAAGRLLLSRPRRWPGGTALGVAVLTDVNCSFGRYELPERRGLTRRQCLRAGTETSPRLLGVAP